MTGSATAGMRLAALRVAQCIAVTLLLLGAARGEPREPADAAPAEARLKAAFICKFGNYVEWPAGDKKVDEPFAIGAFTSDAVVAELTRAAAGNTINGRPIVIRKLAPGDSLDGLDVIYVARNHSEGLASTLASARGRPILTVTESDPALGDGGMVNFVVVDDRVRFDIVPLAAERSSLKISGRLLALARKVIGAPS